MKSLIALLSLVSLNVFAAQSEKFLDCKLTKLVDASYFAEGFSEENNPYVVGEVITGSCSSKVVVSIGDATFDKDIKTYDKNGYYVVEIKPEFAPEDTIFIKRSIFLEKGSEHGKVLVRTNGELKKIANIICR